MDRRFTRQSYSVSTWTRAVSEHWQEGAAILQGVPT